MDLVNVFRIARRVTESRPESAGKYSNGSLLPFVHYCTFIHIVHSFGKKWIIIAINFSRNESSLYIYLSLHIYLIIAHLFVQIWIISVLLYISAMLHTFLTNLLKNAPHFCGPQELRDVQLVDSIFPMLRSIGVLMASTSHAPYSLSTTVRSSILNVLEHFSCSVCCCSGIGL